MNCSSRALTLREDGREGRCQIFDIDSGESHSILQDGLLGRLVSPDGKFLIANGRGRQRAAYPVEGGEPRSLSGLEDQDGILNWSADGRSIYVGQGENPLKIYRLDWQAGKRELIHEINYPTAAGIFNINAVLIPPDGKSYAYTYTNIVSDLFLAEGLK
jgi:hypothetical protein